MGLLNKKQTTSSAEVIDKHLILSLPNAIDPVVWRMALDKIGTASFEVKQAKNSDACKLMLKPKKGTVETIASFNKKDETLEALLHASNALQKPIAASNKPSTNRPTTANEKKGGNKWLYLFIGFLVVIGLYAYMSSLIPKQINDFGSTNQTSAAAGNNSQDQSGVAISADDFLSGL